MDWALTQTVLFALFGINLLLLNAGDFDSKKCKWWAKLHNDGTCPVSGICTYWNQFFVIECWEGETLCPLLFCCLRLAKLKEEMGTHINSFVLKMLLLHAAAADDEISDSKGGRCASPKNLIQGQVA